MFTNLTSKFYYWHFFLALLILKYIVFCVIELKQYLYLSNPNIPNELKGFISFAEYTRIRQDEMNYFVFGFYESFGHCIVFLLTFCTGILLQLWSAFQRLCDRAKFLVNLIGPDQIFNRSIIFYSLYLLFHSYIVLPILSFPRDANRMDLLDSANPFEAEKESMKSMLSLWVLKYLFYDSSILRALWTISLAFLFKLTQKKSIKVPLLLVLYVHLMLFFIANIGLPAIVGWLNLKLSVKEQQFLQPFQGLLNDCGFPKGHVLVMADLENAFTAGIGRFALIVIGTGLVDSLHHTTSEMVAIVAHELGHWHYNHTAFNFILYSIIIGCAMTLLVFLMRNKSFYKSFDISTDKEIPFGIGLILITGLAQLLLFFLQPLMNTFSHLNEYQADAFSASLGHGHHLIEGFKKSHPSVFKLADPLYGLFVYTHPVFSKRVAAIANTIRKFEGRRR